MVIVVLGVVGTIASRQHRDSQISSAGNSAPTVGTTWHEGYAIYECGKFIPPISTKSPDPQGITTNTAGIITIAPKVKDAAGKNATLGKFTAVRPEAERGRATGPRRTLPGWGHV